MLAVVCRSVVCRELCDDHRQWLPTVQLVRVWVKLQQLKPVLHLSSFIQTCDLTHHVRNIYLNWTITFKDSHLYESNSNNFRVDKYFSVFPIHIHVQWQNWLIQLIQLILYASPKYFERHQGRPQTRIIQMHWLGSIVQHDNFQPLFTQTPESQHEHIYLSFRDLTC